MQPAAMTIVAHRETGLSHFCFLRFGRLPVFISVLVGSVGPVGPVVVVVVVGSVVVVVLVGPVVLVGLVILVVLMGLFDLFLIPFKYSGLSLLLHSPSSLLSFFRH